MKAIEKMISQAGKWAIILTAGSVAFVVLAFLATLAHAGQESLAWDYPAGANVSGFKGYCGTASKQYAAAPAWTVAATARTVTATLPAGRVYCIVRAYDALGESGDSNEITLIERPTNLRVTIVTVKWDEENRRVSFTWRSE